MGKQKIKKKKHGKKVTNQFNCDEKVTKRESANLRTCYFNLVQRAKDEHAKFKSSLRKTGGGVNKRVLSETTEAIIGATPTTFQSVKGVHDDDSESEDVVHSPTNDLMNSSSEIIDSVEATTITTRKGTGTNSKVDAGSVLLDVKINHAEEEHLAKMALIEKEAEWKRKEHEMKMEIYNKISEKLLNDSRPTCESYLKLLNDM